MRFVKYRRFAGAGRGEHCSPGRLQGLARRRFPRLASNPACSVVCENGGADIFLDRLGGVTKTPAVLVGAQPSQRLLDAPLAIVSQGPVQPLDELADSHSGGVRIPIRASFGSTFRPHPYRSYPSLNIPEPAISVRSAPKSPYATYSAAGSCIFVKNEVRSASCFNLR